MEKIWEFFEKLDEMVYVSDIETHQIVYMNQRLRDALGYSTQEEYVGKMCYQVLQGSDAPCSFCNNQKLQLGEFLSWTHSNPALQALVQNRFAAAIIILGLIRIFRIDVDGHFKPIVFPV